MSILKKAGDRNLRSDHKSDLILRQTGNELRYASGPVRQNLPPVTYTHTMYRNWRLFSRHSNSDFLKKNSLPCWDLNSQPPWYQADVLPIELSRLG